MTINTTALPDIIFMLLFFFMVSTTIQNDKASMVDLPVAKNAETKLKKEYNDLNIYLSLSGQKTRVSINGNTRDFTDMAELLKLEVNRLKSNNHSADKAILYISEEIEMSYVNAVKKALQSLTIYQVSYIHNGLNVL